MLTISAVAAMGALGAVARWLLSRLNVRQQLPVGTLLANIGGAFLLGILTARGGPALAVVGTGLLGAFTTFSTLMNEVIDQAEGRQHALAISYLAVTFITGVAAATAGLHLA